MKEERKEGHQKSPQQGATAEDDWSSSPCGNVGKCLGITPPEKRGSWVCVHLPCPHWLRAFLEDPHCRCCERPRVQAELPSPASDRVVKNRYGHGESAEVQQRGKPKGSKSDCYIHSPASIHKNLCISIQSCFSLKLKLSKQFASNFPWNSASWKAAGNLYIDYTTVVWPFLVRHE